MGPGSAAAPVLNHFSTCLAPRICWTAMSLLANRRSWANVNIIDWVHHKQRLQEYPQINRHCNIISSSSSSTSGIQTALLACWRSLVVIDDRLKMFLFSDGNKTRLQPLTRSRRRRAQTRDNLLRYNSLYQLDNYVFFGILTFCSRWGRIYLLC